MFSAIRARLRLSSVPARLTFWYLLTLGASLAGFAVFVYVVRARTLYRELDAELDEQAHRVVAALRPALLALDPGAELAGDVQAAAWPIVVRQVPGRVLYRSPVFPELDWAGERWLASVARTTPQFVSATGRTAGAVRIVTHLVDRPGAETLAVQLAAPTAPVRRTLAQLALVMALAIALVLVVASYGSTSTARRALAPVDEIVRRVRHIQAEQLGARLDVHAGSEELDRLVATLNEMLDRIEASMRAARRFAADASHELQTPVAAMRAAVELCLKGERQAGDYRDMAVDLLAEIERLSALIRDLRLLALADAGHLVANPELVDLAAIASDCCEIARSIAEDRAIRIETRIDAHPIVRGSALHLRRVVLNLTDNAIRYSPPASVVCVSVGLRDGLARVVVRDEGCGIDPVDLPHIFEPFYRADPARARETGGTGLGLAIADQVVRAHGGRIEVASVPGRGSTFTVSLPVAPLSA
jgi:signal transduction histidine kinase